MRTRLVSGVIGAVLAVGLTVTAVAPASAETVQQTRFIKGQTAVTVDAQAVVALDFFDVKVSVVWPASGTSPAFTFPVYGNPNDGTTELAGGLVFQANDKCADAILPVIDTNTGVVRAWVNSGRRVEVFKVDGDKLVLTAAGAQWLNSSLGFNGLFTAGFLFGTFKTTLNR
ncbi:hypothetical protein [Actinocrispum wychmicini]|uniref:Uncharacterized protein n=1 Tax=Actinocrispum wychmicini TaxID=1213861 RepID=A0A4R2JH99_9PSEU|nr:hypothetical protein [Actinocrispum wychmicini]TCO58434.1 hypothetical protein EV192_105503 [Actinocrispum wychmicini]